MGYEEYISRMMLLGSCGEGRDRLGKDGRLFDCHALEKA
jgi:hypothetical protein